MFHQSNPCIRCGKERVDGITQQKEMATLFGTTSIIVTDTQCPDHSCQKIVMEELEVKRQKKEAIAKEKEERMSKILENRKLNRKKVL